MDDGSRHPCQDDKQKKNRATPSFRQGAPESSDQGWEDCINKERVLFRLYTPTGMTEPLIIEMAG